jgi:hypothetical protein
MTVLSMTSFSVIPKIMQLQSSPTSEHLTKRGLAQSSDIWDIRNMQKNLLCLHCGIFYPDNILDIFCAQILK